MINIAIVDDDKKSCDEMYNMIISFFLKKDLEYRAFLFYNAEDLLLNLNHNFDIIFLNIDMPGLNGIDTASILRKNCISSIIIFVTSEIKYMEKSFGLNVFGFITKDKMCNKLPEVLENCINELNTYRIFPLKTNEGIIMVQKDHIMFASLEQRKVYLHTIKDSYCLNMYSLNEFYSIVKFFDDFVYINRSTIVNLSFVSAVRNDKTLIMKDVNQQFPISKYRYLEVVDALMNWASKRGKF